MNKLLGAVKELFVKKMVNTGVIDDTRSQAERAKDYTWSEIGLAMGSIDYTKLPAHPQKAYRVRNQNGSGSCVAQSVAKMFEVLDTKSTNAWSAIPIYTRRNNKPAEGMAAGDALTIATKYGSTYEHIVPSQYMTNAQMDAVSIADAPMSADKPTNWYTIGYNGASFDDIANAVLQNGCAIIFVNASVKEWTSVPKTHTSDGTLRHAVCAVDVIYNYEPYIVIEDSWGTFKNTSTIQLADGQRALSRSFIEKHCYYAGGLVNFEYSSDIKSDHVFTQKMKYGDRSTEVAQLQRKLASLGLFPSKIGGVPFDIDKSGGYYGNVTAKAVYLFQVKYNVASLAELNALKGKQCGAKTIAALNKA
jgi:hypothetical protein